MKVRETYIIGNMAVEKAAQFEGITVFYHENDDEDEQVFFFTRNGVVLQTLTVEASEGQGMGVLTNPVFKTPERETEK